MVSSKKIVLTTFGTLGDLHPAMTIAQELQTRGHHVVIATNEAYRSQVERIGINFHPLRPNLPVELGWEWTKLVLDGDIKNKELMDLFCSTQRQTYEDLLKATQTADLLVSMNCTVVVAPLVAEKTKIRWVTCFLDPYYVFYDVMGVSQFAWLNHLVVKVVTFLLSFVPSVLLLHKQISYLRASLELPPVKLHMFLSKLSSPQLVLAMYSSVLARRLSSYPANTQITGFVFLKSNQKLPPALAEFLDAGPKPIVFTLGSSAVYSADALKFYTESAISAKKLGYRAILLVGNVPQNLPKELLTEDIIAVDYAPYSELFKRAAAVVHQGGIGTTSQTLLAGIPMLVVPYSHEQPDNAARIVRLGIGLRLNPKQYCSQRVTIELNKLLTQPKYKAKTLAARNYIQSENGIQNACDAIEKQLKIGEVESDICSAT